MKQRIEALLDEDKITSGQSAELMQRERYVRGALHALMPKLGESFDDFMSRSYEHAQCRARQHRWDEIENFLDYRPIGAAFYETERCNRCRMVKIIIVNGIGQKDRPRYIPTPSYALEGAKITKSDWKILLRYMKLEFEIQHLEQGEARDDNVVPLHA